MNRMKTVITSKFTKRLLISAFFLVITLLFSILFDRIIGVFLEKDVANNEGIVFPPRSTFKYQTGEFDFTADINSLGFRDREFALDRGDETRILAVGDSFTYGWGVAADESFPKLLEFNLRQTGDRVEIANLGQPGASPSTYARIADKAIPILKPDLVVVFILQGDDLASAKVIDKQLPDTDLPTLRGRITSFSRRLYPNFLRFLTKPPAPPPPLNELWKNQAETIAQAFTPQEKFHFDNADARVKQAFVNGELNPALIQSVIKQPRYFLDIYNNDQPEVQSLISAMAGSVARIKATAEQFGSEVIVVSVPYKVYASRRDFESGQRLGLDLIPEMTENDSADEAIKSACQIAGVKFFSVMSEFRKAAADKRLFFEMDGHFNQAGHRVFADLLTTQLVREQRGAK